MPPVQNPNPDRARRTSTAGATAISLPEPSTSVAAVDGQLAVADSDDEGADNVAVVEAAPAAQPANINPSRLTGVQDFVRLMA